MTVRRATVDAESDPPSELCIVGYWGGVWRERRRVINEDIVSIMGERFLRRPGEHKTHGQGRGAVRMCQQTAQRAF